MYTNTIDLCLRITLCLTIMNPLFISPLMGDVTPLKQDTVELPKTHNVTEAHIARRKAAIWLDENDPQYLSLEHAPMLKPEDLIEFKRDGVQEGVYRKLRLVNTLSARWILIVKSW